MPRPNASLPLSPEELAQAVADLAEYMSPSRAKFSICGGAASMLVRMQNGLPLRSTEDIDLVVQPTAGVTAQSISTWLLQNYPTAFVAKKHYGVSVPALAFHRSDGSVKHIEIEIFDVNAWPQRPQYNLDSPDNDVTMVSISGVQVPVFSARWLLREKIMTAFDRQGTRKERSDLDDACALLDTVEPSSVDLTNKEAAVRHLIARRPDVRQSLELKIVCPAVLGMPWTWNEPAAVYWRWEKDQLRYLDADLRRHKFKWDEMTQVWYLTAGGQDWFYSAENADIALWT
ncbi:antigen [Pochonia chlamydosporia 170]|uniref:Antigen n=1 Tax=Pochonia chlamydosporia 170 TaxID=1380566 RepID=A0A179F4Y2_METCM|nr:antigen [Pochonia chlamydosporia 170]OAQ60169.1 antigen [Pochonia chlamydosporia 170]